MAYGIVSFVILRYLILQWGLLLTTIPHSWCRHTRIDIPFGVHLGPASPKGKQNDYRTIPKQSQNGFALASDRALLLELKGSSASHGTSQGGNPLGAVFTEAFGTVFEGVVSDTTDATAAATSNAMDSNVKAEIPSTVSMVLATYLNYELSGTLTDSIAASLANPLTRSLSSFYRSILEIPVTINCGRRVLEKMTKILPGKITEVICDRHLEAVVSGQTYAETPPSARTTTNLNPMANRARRIDSRKRSLASRLATRINRAVPYVVVNTLTTAMRINKKSFHECQACVARRKEGIPKFSSQNYFGLAPDSSSILASDSLDLFKNDCSECLQFEKSRKHFDKISKYYTRYYNTEWSQVYDGSHFYIDDRYHHGQRVSSYQPDPFVEPPIL